MVSYVTLDPAISAVAALDDELRREMYAFIRAAHRPVTREEAAESAGISRKLAAFHLDKLVDAGLLHAHYRPAGLRKVGRAPKVYEPTGTDIEVSIPQRQYALLADILVDAVASGSGGHEAAVRVATQRGEELGRATREHLKPGRLGPERALSLISTILARHGFEPARDAAACVRLRNCPFHRFATKAPDLVCGINHAFVTGLLTGLGAASVRAELSPRPGECCVQLSAAQR